MADLVVDLAPDKNQLRLSIHTEGGVLTGVIINSDVLAKLFGKKNNPAKWKLLKYLKATVAWLDRIEVVKAKRGLGIGEGLMRAALDIAVENGARYALLSPRPERPDDLDRLIRFYGRLGFQEIREFDGEKLWYPLMLLSL